MTIQQPQQQCVDMNNRQIEINSNKGELFKILPSKLIDIETFNTSESKIEKINKNDDDDDNNNNKSTNELINLEQKNMPLVIESKSKWNQDQDEQVDIEEKTKDNISTTKNNVSNNVNNNIFDTQISSSNQIPTSVKLKNNAIPKISSNFMTSIVLSTTTTITNNQTKPLFNQVIVSSNKILPSFSALSKSSLSSSSTLDNETRMIEINKKFKVQQQYDGELQEQQVSPDNNSKVFE